MIDTQALRSKILDLAIRGRLSKQLDSEIVDCDDIQNTVTEPFSIPSNWKWLTIESVVSKNLGGGTPSKSVSEYWENGTIPWMSVKDFSSAQNCFLEDTIDHITLRGLENSASNLIDTDAIIICMRMALGKIVKIKRPMAINQDLRAIWLKSFVDGDYFYFFYSTLKVEGHGMTVAGINKKQLMNYMIPIPPLPEQRRIVERIKGAFSILDTIDALQAQYADNLTVLKGKLIDAAIQGKLTEQLPEDGTAEELYRQIQVEEQELIKAGKFKKKKQMPEVSEKEKAFVIPENWKWVRLGDLISIESGMGLTAAEMISGDVPVYGGNGITGYHNKSFVPKGTVVIGRVGYYCGSVHITTSDAWVTDNAFITSYPENSIDRSFLVQVLRKMKLGQNNNGSAQPVVSGKKIYPLAFPLPPLAEQRRIADRLEEVLPICEGLK